METPSTLPAPSTVELLKQHLTDWHNLKAQLASANENRFDQARATDIVFCEAKAIEIESDLVMLTGSDTY